MGLRALLFALGSFGLTALAVWALLPREPGPAAAAGVAAVAAGGQHACALTDGGGLRCWGDNTYGQLGDGTTTQRATPVAVIGLPSAVVAVAAGGNHTCALTEAGGVKCWGSNRYGQLGNPGARGGLFPNPQPTDVVGLDSGVIAIATGGVHTCALTKAGGVKCWGWDRRGQVGNSETCSNSICATPRDVDGLASGVTAIDAGDEHTCALLGTGALKCWGNNQFGQLGAATGSPCTTEGLEPLPCAPTPVDVAGLAGAAAVAAGGAHTCALTSEGGIKCWGDNSSGQLGDGQACGAICSTPVDVSGLTSGVAVLAAAGGHTCAVTMAGPFPTPVAACWGDNESGQIGNGESPTDALTPVGVCEDATCGIGVICVPELPCGTLANVAGLALGSDHSCARMESGALKCWGSNASGQLGDGGACGAACDTPVDVLGVKGALPDLVVTGMRIELEPGASCLMPGRSLGIWAEFANIGNADAGPFVVEVNGAQQTIGLGLPQGATASLWFASYPLGGDSTAMVDATFLIEESNEENNRLTMPLPLPTPPPTCTPTPTPTATPTPRARPGDADCDGAVSAIDAALVLQYSAGLLASLRCPAAADANSDGRINAIDAALILQYVAGLLPRL